MAEEGNNYPERRDVIDRQRQGFERVRKLDIAEVPPAGAGVSMPWCEVESDGWVSADLGIGSFYGYAFAEVGTFAEQDNSESYEIDPDGFSLLLPSTGVYMVDWTFEFAFTLASPGVTGLGFSGQGWAVWVAGVITDTGAVVSGNFYSETLQHVEYLDRAGDDQDLFQNAGSSQTACRWCGTIRADIDAHRKVRFLLAEFNQIFKYAPNFNGDSLGGSLVDPAIGDAANPGAGNSHFIRVAQISDAV